MHVYFFSFWGADLTNTALYHTSFATSHMFNFEISSMQGGPEHVREHGPPKIAPNLQNLPQKNQHFLFAYNMPNLQQELGLHCLQHEPHQGHHVEGRGDLVLGISFNWEKK